MRLLSLMALVGFLLVGCGNNNDCPSGVNTTNPNCPGYTQNYPQSPYYPQQPGYQNPQQPGYNPQQPGYQYPQQPGYNPQQPGYQYPQQPGYPYYPQQPGYQPYYPR